MTRPIWRSSTTASRGRRQPAVQRRGKPHHLVEDAAGEQIEVTLPQSGEYADLVKGAPVHIGWSAEQGNAFAVGAA